MRLLFGRIRWNLPLTCNFPLLKVILSPTRQVDEHKKRQRGTERLFCGESQGLRDVRRPAPRALDRVFRLTSTSFNTFTSSICIWLDAHFCILHLKNRFYHSHSDLVPFTAVSSGRAIASTSIHHMILIGVINLSPPWSLGNSWKRCRVLSSESESAPIRTTLE